VWKTEEETPDMMQFVAVAFSLAGLLMKLRLLTWSSLLFVVVGLVNAPLDQLTDPKHILSSSMVAIVGLIMSYLPGQRDLWT
jgi:hypothetical protein